MQTGIAFCFAKNINGNKFVGSYSMGKLKLSIRIKNIIHIYKITFFCYNEIYFSELFYSFGQFSPSVIHKLIDQMHKSLGVPLNISELLADPCVVAF